MKKTLPLCILTALLAVLSKGFAQEEGGGHTIQRGSRVSIEYTLSDSNGNVIESNSGKEPLTYTQGEAQILPALEKELAGLKAGDRKTIVLQPQDAYGEVDPKAFREIPKASLPPDALKVGTQLTATSPAGKRYPVRIHEIKDDTVVVDFNHPLAGKTLSFAINVLRVEGNAAK
ncbi:MAG TPA: peptidylprolyl isomerase [Candidatus Acidoferrales bacterium]|nr:peptidylprolyl isomerase [Candidatus Acidoferrales bacterium]